MKFELIMLAFCAIIFLINSVFGFSDNIITCEGNNCRAATNFFKPSNVVDFERSNISNIFYEQVVIHRKGAQYAYDIYVQYNDGRNIKICRIRYKSEDYVQKQLEKMNQLISSRSKIKMKF